MDPFNEPNLFASSIMAFAALLRLGAENHQDPGTASVKPEG
jgi:hypothetical protein